MHFYLFDAFLADSKYKKDLEEIENRILDLGIGGRSTYLTVLKSFEDSLKNGLTKEITTCVLVGDDTTLNKALDIVVPHNLTIGFIPLGPHCHLAHCLGIPKAAHAVDLIANRLTENLDLGQINNQYFLGSINAKSADLTFACDQKYTLQLKHRMHISLCNLESSSLGVADPRDGLLELWIYSEEHGFLFSKKRLRWDSRLYHRQFEITAKKETSLTIDNHKIIKTPATIKILPRHLKIIVGRERVFNK